MSEDDILLSKHSNVRHTCNKYDLALVLTVWTQQAKIQIYFVYFYVKWLRDYDPLLKFYRSAFPCDCATVSFGENAALVLLTDPPKEEYWIIACEPSFGTRFVGNLCALFCQLCVISLEYSTWQSTVVWYKVCFKNYLNVQHVTL